MKAGRPRTPETEERFGELRERFGMPPDLARAVARGGLDLSSALKTMQLREVAEKLVADGCISLEEARSVERGRKNLEDVIFSSRVRAVKRSPDYTRSLLSHWSIEERSVVLAVMGGGLHQGALSAETQYQIEINTTEDLVSVEKHDLKFFFESKSRKRLLKRGIKWGPDDLRLAPGALQSFNSRADIKARQLLEVQDSERVVTWVTVEGDRLRCRIRSFGRYEVRTETPQGLEVILMRHAFRSLE
jgi:hypothetical protein